MAISEGFESTGVTEELNAVLFERLLAQLAPLAAHLSTKLRYIHERNAVWVGEETSPTCAVADLCS